MARNQTEIFNSVEEFELRILVLLSETNKAPLSMESIDRADFMAIYGADFGITDENLHGENIFKFQEKEPRYVRIKSALSELVEKRLVSFSMKNGYAYEITDKGEDFIDEVDGLYEEEYRRAISALCKKYDISNDKKLKKVIVAAEKEARNVPNQKA